MEHAQSEVAQSQLGKLSARAVLAACVAAFGCSFGLTAYYFAPQFNDDAYIFYRYAHRLAWHAEPLWNPGEPPVEGYSSTLWLVLLALGDRARLSLPGFAQALGLSLALLALLGTVALARALGTHRAVAWLCASGAALGTGLLAWAPSGMDTSLHAAVLIWLCVGLARRSETLTGIGLLLLGVTRPEGPGLVLVGWLCAARAQFPRRSLVRLAAYGFIPVGALLAFRLLYYGALLPNTYYAKATGALADVLSVGLLYTAPLPTLYAVLGLGNLLTPSIRARRAGEAVWGLGMAQLAIVAGGGGDWMLWSRLNVAPSLVMWALLGAQCTAWLPSLRAFKSWLAGAALALALVIAVPTISIMPLLAAAHGQQLPPCGRQEGTLLKAARDVAAYVREHYPPDTLLAVNHIGMLSYALPEYRFLDMTGLNDLHIARETHGGLHEKFDVDYVLKRAPRLIVLETLVEPGTGGRIFHPGYWAGTSKLAEQSGFQRDYQFLPRAWHWCAVGRGVYTLVAERR